LQVIRPADPNETAAAWATAVTHDGPTAIILSRQNVPSITDGSAVSPGAATIHTVSAPQAVLVGTGSEVSVAKEAAALLQQEGIEVNVVSMPSWERFGTLTIAEQNKILLPHVPRISVEAGSTFGWKQFVTHSIGIDRFGASAPGNTVMKELGITARHVADVTKVAIGR
jgi:transketolase